MPSYLRKRRLTYYVRVRVPPSLKHVLGHAIEVSLKTRDLKVAERKKHAVVGLIKERIEQVRAAERARASANPADRIVATALTLRELLRLGRVDQESAALELDAALDNFIREQGYALHPTTGHPIDMEPAVEQKVKAAFRLVTLPDEYTVAEAMRMYLAEAEKRVTRQTLNAKHRHLAEFRDWIGGDTLLRDVTGPKAGRYVATVLLPRRKSAKTTREVILSIGAFFSWAKRLHMVESNPFEGQASVVKESDRGRVTKRPWRPDELLRLLTELPDYDLRVLSALALYTGARLNELCELTVENVRDDRLCIGLDAGAKSKAGLRDVPIHPVIAPLIRRLVRNAVPDPDGVTYLVPGLKRGGEDNKRSHEASKRFGRRRRKLGLVDTYIDETGQERDRVDFHSFRRSFTNALERAGVPESTADLITGHRRPGLSYGLYSPGLPLDHLREAVERVDFGDADEAIRQAIAELAS